MEKDENSSSSSLAASIAELPGSNDLELANTALKKEGYHIFKSKKDGLHKFRKIKGNKKYKMAAQKEFDLLAQLMCDWVQGYMMAQQNLNKVMVPFDYEVEIDFAQAPIFISDDWETNTERALVLIQGTGEVRAGLWSRSVCINESIDLGSMIPDIEFAQKNGFSVLVMNPNYAQSSNGAEVDPKISGMVNHSNYCWAKFVEEGACPAQEICVVAHSAGGRCMHQIIVNYEITMMTRVKAIALTDACHGAFHKELSEEGQEWAKQSCIAYDRSKKPLNTPLIRKKPKSIFPEVSAGHSKHAYTTGCARESYLSWFYERCSNI
ncbi:unnamed protein product [Moneuplotes crassus]|uniref:Arb2 domain-containing protein n=2 Tax=Euplotes crassus TaxID=5936 RepID=A0AAD2CYY6_EUPCR|nr:unnamed protein product [Moneuplotes crassus]